MGLAARAETFYANGGKTLVLEYVASTTIIFR